MQQHTTNYIDTFIEVAGDSSATHGEIPPRNTDAPSVATRQFELLNQHPYQFTSDEVLFEVYARKNDLADSEREQAREAFFSKGQPCFRSSPLTKRYGWGVHSDSAGKIALYGIESAEYRKLAGDPALKHVNAMRSKRA